MRLLEKLSYLGVVLPTFDSLLHGGDPYDAAGVDGDNVRLYRGWPASDKLIASWADLAHGLSGGGSVFQSPTWQGALARPFVRVGRYRLCTVHRGDALRAALPLQIGAGGQVESPGEMISDYLEPLVDDDGAESSWRSMLRMLRLECGSDVPIVLHNLYADGRCRATLRAIAADEGLAIEESDCGASARVPLPATWDLYLATLGGKERKELKRKVKNATTGAGAQLECIEAPGIAMHAELERIFGYMEAAGGAKGMKARWTYRPIFRRVAAELALLGDLKVYRLVLQDKPAAGLICFPAPNGPMMWAGGFDGQCAKWSPGIVLFAMTIRAAIEGGAKYFDLLRGQSRYKSELGAVDRPLMRVTLRPAR
jgi:CelD/BcsL family acetyltransferase involved in cellulose biosynthesis